MQSLFLACYLCLQLLNSPDPNVLQERDTSCDQCLTTLIETLDLPSDITTQIENFLTIKKPASEILSNNPTLANAISNFVQEQITPITDSPAETQEELPKGKSSLKFGERLMAGESLVSKNKKYFATLSNHGDFNITTANGTFLENMGCPNSESSPDFNIMIDQHNSLGYFKTIDPNSCLCSTGTTLVCTLAGVKCYLNLDDDGVMRFYSGDGVFEMTYSAQPCHRNKTQQANSEEVEYKGKSTLKRNERLLVGESLVSENSKFKMTLGHYGELVTVDSHGKVINDIDSCSWNFPYSDRWNIFMAPDNWWGLLATVETELPYWTTAPGISWGCTLQGVECYLKLDNDGILKLFNDQGQVEMEYSY